MMNKDEYAFEILGDMEERICLTNLREVVKDSLVRTISNVKYSDILSVGTALAVLYFSHHGYIQKFNKIKAFINEHPLSHIHINYNLF